MFPLRRLLACATVAIAATAAFGAAATLGIAGDDVGAGSSPVGDCDDSVSIDYRNDPAMVDGITISDLAAACATGQLSAVVRGSGGVVLRSVSGTVPSGGGSLLLTFPALDPALIQGWAVSIVAP